MSTIIFDTLKFVMKLEKSGMSFDQAKAMSEALQDIHVEAELATKQDIQDLRHEIKDVKLEMNSKISVMQWMLGVLMTGTGALVTKIFFLS